MIVCKKCNKQLPDGSKFCDSCGTPVPVYENVFCSKCGKQTSTEFAFCQYCGESIAPNNAQPANIQPENVQPENVQPENVQPVNAQPMNAQPMNTQPMNTQPMNVPPMNAQPMNAQPVNVQPAKKNNSTKLLVFGGIGVAFIAVILVAIMLLGGIGGGKQKEYALYIKDKEIFSSSLSSEKPQQITTRFVNTSGVDNSDLVQLANYLGAFCYTSNDGKKIFYPDKIDDSDYLTLYYRFINNQKNEPIKIDSNVSMYHVNDAANLVTYMKDDIVYQYDLKKVEKTKIDSDVSEYQLYISNTGNKIYYVNMDQGLYVKANNKDKEKIDSDVYSISYVSEDFKTIYYTKEDSLYKKVEGQDKEKIASEVQDIISIYDSGAMYYVQSNNSEASLMDYVYDDMEATDADITYPEYPSYPSYWSYDTDEEYYAAVDEYNAQLDIYNEESTKYYEKQSRDYIRELLNDETMSNNDYTLYYYDGKEEKVITDAFNYYSNYSASNEAVIIFKAYIQSNIDKIKLSEITSTYDVSSMVNAAKYSSKEMYVACGENVTLIEQEDAKIVGVDEDGKTIYYIDEIMEERSYGELYRIDIENKKVSKPQLYDNDVSTQYAYFIDKDKFMYFKDFKQDNYYSYKGEMYINKERIDYDVNLSYSRYSNYMPTMDDSGRIYYFVDWNDEKEYGTLKMYEKGKSTKIADDVHSFTVVNDELLYTYDYSLTSYKGDLYKYKKGKPEKVDIDVVGIASNFEGNYRGSRVMYSMYY